MFDIETATIPADWAYLNKARENYLCALEAAQHKWYNAATSRLYYASCLATREYIRVRGMAPQRPDPNGQWTHGEIAEVVGLIGNDHGSDVTMRGLRRLRNMADYDRAMVSACQLPRYRAFAENLFNHVFKELLRAEPGQDQ